MPKLNISRNDYRLLKILSEVRGTSIKEGFTESLLINLENLMLSGEYEKCTECLSPKDKELLNTLADWRMVYEIAEREGYQVEISTKKKDVRSLSASCTSLQYSEPSEISSGGPVT